ncbi:MAG: hypothetical protein HY906_11105 [Deltaproteobacteria bacterium]|nr:hypothetical protein [Deltaproteobacteria bacterium]
MDPESGEQTELLRGIWNEMKALGQNLGGRIDQTNARLDAVRTELSARIADTSARIDQTNARIDAMRSDFGQALAGVETRLGSELRSLAGAVQGVSELLRQRAVERERLAECEEDIAELKGRVERVEQRLGG